MLSVITSRSTSAGSILPSAATVSRSQSTSPRQYDDPNRTIGKWRIFSVCRSVAASNSSSSVPNPPGKTTNALA